MRCKPNDLAVISRTSTETREFQGLLVDVLRLVTDGDFGMTSKNTKYGPFWVVSFCSGRRPTYPHNDHKLPPTLGVWPDAWLRPIRNDGSRFDESMFWVKVKKHART